MDMEPRKLEKWLFRDSLPSRLINRAAMQQGAHL
jgi:hypothetical protein